ncbi:MAG: LytTR family DNA-binding domain-containing protein [Bacteroidota bacterium]
MNNVKIYSFLALSFVVLLLTVLIAVLPFWELRTSKHILQTDISEIQTQTNDFASFAQVSLKNGVAKTHVLEGIQTVISNTLNKNYFVVVIDWSGTIVAHPDITQVGSLMKDETSALGSMEIAYTPAQLYEMRKTNTAPVPVLLQPIKGSDLILVSYMNMGASRKYFQKILDDTHLLLAFIGLLALLLVLGTLRYVSGMYETALAKRTTIMEDGVINLEKLNNSLEEYQKRVIHAAYKTPIDNSKSHGQEEEREVEKSRLLTYHRNEILPVFMEDIAYIYVENTITHIIQRSGKRSTSNESLDQIYGYLDENSFFKANRQIIVAITAIDRIVKFGKSQLKIEALPPSDLEIIIGKNKAAAFKQWLDS